MSGHENHIFDSDPSPIGYVNAGFDRENHPFQNRSIVFAVDGRVLMDSEANTVACPVTKIFPVSFTSNVIPCRSIHVANGDARPDLLNRLIVSFFDDLIDLLLF